MIEQFIIVAALLLIMGLSAFTAAAAWISGGILVAIAITGIAVLINAAASRRRKARG